MRKVGAFDKFELKEKTIRKTIEIEDELYEKLKDLSQNVYDTSVNKMINAAIEELIKYENIQLYKKESKSLAVKHSLLIKTSLADGLDKLKEKYELSIYKLVNMAIRNAINQLENKDKS